MNLKPLGYLTAGGANAALLDRISYGDYSRKSMSERRVLNGVFNAMLGAGSMGLMRHGHGAAGASLFAAAPIKDVALAAQKPLHDWSELTNKQIRTEKAKAALFGLLGLGALGVSGAAVYNAADRHKKSKEESGTITVTLPTKNPGDAETRVMLPLVRGKLPKSILQQVNRDVKRRMRAGGAERTRRRN